MKVMSVNAGSSSLKFQLLEMPEEVTIASGVVEAIGEKGGKYTIKYNGEKYEKSKDYASHTEAVDEVINDLLNRKILKSLDEIVGVGHRIVHGGPNFTTSVAITDAVVEEIQSHENLSPLHTRAHIAGIKAFRAKLKDTFQIVVFDTAFHQTMAPDAYMYAVPYDWYEKNKVRKYGFHGTSHEYVSSRCIDLMGRKKEGTKIITLHIGNGASLAAVKDGKCVDTSMGLGPLAGIPMGSRSGTVDPTIIEYIAKERGYSLEKILSDLNKESGYKGISGVSNDSRAVEAAASEGNEYAKLALDMQAKSIADYIGSYYVYMEGLDALVFTAGIGENSKLFRKRVLDRLGVLGVKYDEKLNEKRGEEIKISTPDSKVLVYIIPTNEELAIAREVMRLK